MASLKYLEMLELINFLNGDFSAEIEKIRHDLRLYCKRDTEAMVALLSTLHKLSSII